MVWGRPALFGLFFLSGGAALIYQTAWHRLLGLFAGADTIAAALVVGAFLLGLGIGSLAGGALADRLSRPASLAAFAICEIGIAVFAVASPWLYYDVIYLHLLPVASSRFVIFVVVFAGLLWPTFLMGCSLPLLSRALVEQIEGSARLIGWLYGVNTFGAAVGAAVGGWLLIGTIGFDGAIRVAALLNLIVAGGGLALWAGVRREAQASPPIAAARTQPEEMRTVYLWAALVFISGFLIVALQIVWFRLIGVLLQSNSYGFSLVLSVFLLGDAAGLLVGARIIHRIADPRRFFFQMQAVATALALAGAWFVYWGMGVGLLPDSFVDRDVMQGTAKDVAVIALLLVVVVLPASFVMGLSFPVVQKAVQRDIGQLGRRVGIVQLANIVGNSAGSLVSGLVLLDLAGTAGTLKLLVAIGLGFAILHLATSPARRWAYAPAILLVLGVAFFPPTEQFWRRLHNATNEPVIFAEDKTGVSLLKMNTPQDGILYIQGHSQSRLPYMPGHIFLGSVGPLTHPAPRRVMVIGSGTGGTPYSAGLNPATETVLVVEIVAPVIETLRRYVLAGGRPGTDALLGDSRFKLMVADGRHTMALDPERYDVIEADAMYPKTGLSGLLYSEEFFRQVRAKLAPGGVYVQWAATERIVETLRAVFPYVVGVNFALLASDRPIPYDTTKVLDRLREPAIARRLAATGSDLESVRRMFIDGPPRILNNGAAVPARSPNTDFFPRDEFYLNRP